MENPERLQLLDKLIQMASESARGNRSEKLLRTLEPVDNEGWAFYLPSSYKTALDIRPETILKPPPCSFALGTYPNKNSCTKSCTKVVWKQGANFDFSRGDMIYDTPAGYRDWREAIKEIKTVIQVSSASAAAPPTAELPRYPGRVEFRILLPNNDRTMIEEYKTAMLTQDEFVRYLITGDL